MHMFEIWFDKVLIALLMMLTKKHKNVYFFKLLFFLFRVFPRIHAHWNRALQEKMHWGRRPFPSTA